MGVCVGRADGSVPSWEHSNLSLLSERGRDAGIFSQGFINVSRAMISFLEFCLSIYTFNFLKSRLYFILQIKNVALCYFLGN